MKVRLRLSADPYTSLTVSDGRNVLFNWLFRHHHHGTLIMRLDDVNFRAEGVDTPRREDSLDVLRWLGMDWDEGPDKPGQSGPYKVSERLPIYKEWVQKLLSKGQAYMCFESPEELEEMYIQQKIHGHKPRYDRRGLKLTAAEREALLAQGKPYTVRLKVPDHVVELTDIIRGKLVYNGPEHSDFVIQRGDGVPTRAFANVVDDHLLGVTHVIRGEEDLADAPFVGFIAEALGFTLPLFVFIPMILGGDKTRLSGRHGLVGLADHRAQGYLSEALVNYLVGHGWEPGDQSQLRTLGSLAKAFHIEQIKKVHSVWEVEKLRVFNRMAIEKLKDEALIDLLSPYLRTLGYDLTARGKEWALDFISAIRPGLATLGEVKDHGETWFASEVEPDKKGITLLKDPDALKVVNALEDAVRALKSVDKENYRELVEAARGSITNKGKALVLTRVLLSGRETGPEFSRLVPLLGRELILARLEYIRRHIPRGSRRG